MSNHTYEGGFESQTLTGRNFAALSPTETHSTFWNDLDLVINIGFAKDDHIYIQLI